MPLKRRSVAIAVNMVLIAVGLLAIGWAVTMGLRPQATCHGWVMHPGDVCRRLEIDGSDKGKTQSYDDAIAERRNAVPVLVGLGVVAAGFGAVLLRAELRRRHDVEQAADQLVAEHGDQLPPVKPTSDEA